MYTNLFVTWMLYFKGIFASK